MKAFWQIHQGESLSISEGCALPPVRETHENGGILNRFAILGNDLKEDRPRQPRLDCLFSSHVARSEESDRYGPKYAHGRSQGWQAFGAQIARPTETWGKCVRPSTRRRPVPKSPNPTAATPTFGDVKFCLFLQKDMRAEMARPHRSPTDSPTQRLGRAPRT